MAERRETTELLEAWSDGNGQAFDEVLPRLYDELRRRASRCLRREAPGHTLETSALVHEVYVRLADHERARWRSREHFMAVSSHLMRRILVDHARHHGYLKRGGGKKALPLEEAATVSLAKDARLEDLDEGLEHLGTLDPELVQIVELRFFGGLDNDEIASLLGVSRRTVIRRWRLAQAWLYRFLRGEGETPP